ncbi:MAG: dihydrofolate reductase family protein [Pyrinomonadaceae bacterium]
MRKVTFGGACSLDNFFARADGGMDWLMWCDGAMEIANQLWPKVDTIIMGRKTYEVAMAGQAGNEESGSEEGAEASD